MTLNKRKQVKDEWDSTAANASGRSIPKLDDSGSGKLKVHVSHCIPWPLVWPLRPVLVFLSRRDANVSAITIFSFLWASSVLLSFFLLRKPLITLLSSWHNPRTGLGRAK